MRVHVAHIRTQACTSMQARMSMQARTSMQAHTFAHMHTCSHGCLQSCDQASAYEHEDQTQRTVLQHSVRAQARDNPPASQSVRQHRQSAASQSVQQHRLIPVPVCSSLIFATASCTGIGVFSVSIMPCIAHDTPSYHTLHRTHLRCKAFNTHQAM